MTPTLTQLLAERRSLYHWQLFFMSMQLLGLVLLLASRWRTQAMKHVPKIIAILAAAALLSWLIQTYGGNVG